LMWVAPAWHAGREGVGQHAGAAGVHALRWDASHLHSKWSAGHHRLVHCGALADLKALDARRGVWRIEEFPLRGAPTGVPGALLGHDQRGARPWG